MESMVLIGADDVRQAGSKMKDAARSVEQSVANLDEVLQRALNRFEELVIRLETNNK